MSAYAPFNVSYAQRTPYLTTAEYQNAPTAIDTNNLVANGTGVSQTTALQEVIGRASSIIDGECMGAWGTLCATVDTENARVWGSNSGTFVIHPKYWPVLEVQAFTYGTTPSTGASITPQGNIWVEPSGFVVSPGGVVGLGLNGLAGIVPRFPYFCSWTYVNGWPNTTLSASVAAGATSIEPASVVGIYPGTELTVYDAPTDEAVTVASTYTPGAATVPITSPLQYQHAAGVSVTNLPPAVKQAAISLTTLLIKARGSGALEVSDLNAISHLASSTDNQDAAGDLEIVMWGIRAVKQMMFQGY